MSEWQRLKNCRIDYSSSLTDSLVVLLLDRCQKIMACLDIIWQWRRLARITQQQQLLIVVISLVLFLLGQAQWVKADGILRCALAFEVLFAFPPMLQHVVLELARLSIRRVATLDEAWLWRGASAFKIILGHASMRSLQASLKPFQAISFTLVIFTTGSAFLFSLCIALFLLCGNSKSLLLLDQKEDVDTDQE